MKFVISENKFKNTIFKYLNFTLEKIEFSGDYYFSYKGTDNIVIKGVDENDNGKLKVKVSSHIIDDVSSVFAIKGTQSMEYIWDWTEEKTNKTILNMERTPYFVRI